MSSSCLQKNARDLGVGERYFGNCNPSSHATRGARVLADGENYRMRHADGLSLICQFPVTLLLKCGCGPPFPARKERRGQNNFRAREISHFFFQGLLLQPKCLLRRSGLGRRAAKNSRMVDAFVPKMDSITSSSSAQNSKS